MEKIQEIRQIILLVIISLVMTFILINFSLINVSAADPEGPDVLNVTANETKSSVSAKMVNISGGRIATLDLNATIQNPRWKGFVGQVSGKFTLDDSTGSTLYDWTLSSLTGRVYATRNSSSITWSSINCSNGTILSQEDSNMNHSNPDDNITVTFNATNMSISSGFGTHSAFYVGSIYFSANSCPTLNTYINNVTQDTDFEEIALYDNTNVIYATILEDDLAGFDSNTYDFQMIVPENGLASFQGATAYYIYVEIGT